MKQRETASGGSSGSPAERTADLEHSNQRPETEERKEASPISKVSTPPARASSCVEHPSLQAGLLVRDLLAYIFISFEATQMSRLRYFVCDLNNVPGIAFEVMAVRAGGAAYQGQDATRNGHASGHDELC